MGKLRAFIGWIKRKYDILAEKKYTTIAGTLVYFLLMSVTPFAFWLTLVFGKLDSVEGILELPIFASVKNVLYYIRGEAIGATTGASVLLIGTTLYSSTNFFYHIRRSGEIIYSFRRKKHGFAVRIGALLLMFSVMLLAVLFTLIFAGGAFVFSRILPRWAEIMADYLLLAAVSFALVMLLNAYICPYKTKFKEILPGSVITVAAWAVAVFGFGIYLKFGNPGRLYGALSTVIVFMLWLYVLMICFVSGAIFNSEYISSKESKKL